MLKVYQRRLGNSNVLSLQGQLVTSETSTLREKVFSETTVAEVILDLARVSRIDAGGLGLLLELREHTLARKIGFKLINVQTLVLQVFQISRLDSVFEILPGNSVSKGTIAEDLLGREVALCC